MLTVDSFKAKVLELGPAEFNAKYLFDTKVWYFDEGPDRNDFGNYDDFRLMVSKLFRVNNNEIAIFGSAKYGFSCSPEKGFKEFNEESDIDVAVISSALFRSTWQALLDAHYGGAGKLRRQETPTGSVGYDVFRRFITLRNDFDFVSKHLRDTQVLLDDVQRSVATQLGIAHPLTFRIYRSFDDLQAYHNWGIFKLAENITQVQS